MNIYHLSCFITVCRYMSFTKAANQLVITQQGISKIITRMEEELGAPLFIRRNSRLELTEYGKLFLNSALNILREYNNVTEQIAEMKLQNNQTLNVFIPTGMINVFPFEDFDSFRQLHPKINVNLQQASDTECENALVSGKADVAFCALPLDPEMFTVHAKKSQPVYFLLSRNNPLSRFKSLNVNQLRKERFITIDAENKCGNDFVSRCQKAGFMPNVYMRSSDTQLIYGLCQKNGGKSFLVGEPVDIPEGLAVIPEDPPNVWEVAIATLTYRKPSEAAEEFIRFFQNW